MFLGLFQVGELQKPPWVEVRGSSLHEILKRLPVLQGFPLLKQSYLVIVIKVME